MTIDVRIANCCECKQPKIKCRLCLTGNVEMSEIFMYTGDDLMTKKIFSCSGIIIEQDDSYSTLICAQCKLDIYKLTQFRSMIIENDQRIKRFLGQRQEITEYGDPAPRTPNKPKTNQTAAKRRKISDENSASHNDEDESTEKRFKKPVNITSKKPNIEVIKPNKETTNKISLEAPTSPKKGSKLQPSNPTRRNTTSSSESSLNEKYSCNCCGVSFTALADFEHHKISLAHKYYMGEDVGDYVPAPVIIKTEDEAGEDNDNGSSIKFNKKHGKKKKIVDDDSTENENIRRSKRHDIEILEPDTENPEGIYCDHCKIYFENINELELAHQEFKKFVIQISQEERENAWLEFYAQQSGKDNFQIVSDDDDDDDATTIAD